MEGYRRYVGGTPRGAEEVSGAGPSAAVGGQDGGGGEGPDAGYCGRAGVEAWCDGLSFGPRWLCALLDV